MPTCPIHGCELVTAIVPIQYGYPIMDETRDLEQENPYHGLYELGGCTIALDSPRSTTSRVCPVCRQNVQAGNESTNDAG